MQSIRDLPSCENIPIVVRAALNVPVVHGRVASDYRLQRALPTMRYLADHGARIIVISHIDPPENSQPQGTETLRPAADVLGKLLPGVSFFPEATGPRVRAAIHNLLPGHILVLENLRRQGGERTNDPAFVRELAALGDFFVQDSFDTCHRVHASIVGIPQLLPSYAGLLLEEEVQHLTRARTPKRPALAIIGGAKFATKEPVLTTLLETYDRVFVGGALANDFLKASGQEVGKSLLSNADEHAVKKILVHPKLVLPIDSVVKNEAIVDHGPGTIALLADFVQKAKTILWNGPLGNYENGFSEATDACACAIANSSAHSIVGGGDTVAAIEKLGLLSQFSFVSTGGGAMLEFLARGTLPGIDALG